MQTANVNLVIRFAKMDVTMLLICMAPLKAAKIVSFFAWINQGMKKCNVCLKMKTVLINTT